MAKAVKSPAGRRLRQFAFTYGDVVEIEMGPTPEIHLHYIFSSSKAVLVYVANGSEPPVHPLELKN